MFGRHRRRIDSRHGRYVVRLDARERALLRQLLGDLRALLALAPDDPRVRRLYPDAYADDRESEAEYRRLTREELQNGRLASVDAVEASVDKDVLTLDEAGRIKEVTAFIVRTTDLPREEFARWPAQALDAKRVASVFEACGLPARTD